MLCLQRMVKTKILNINNGHKLKMKTYHQKIVLTDKQVASEEAYTPTDSELPSNYRKGDDGKIFVERNGATVFTGRYVTVKDKNNKVLGKALKNY